MAAESLQSSAKAAIDEIVNSGDGGTFLEITEGQGNTAQVSIFLFIFSKLFFIYLTQHQIIHLFSHLRYLFSLSFSLFLSLSLSLSLTHQSAAGTD